jgi:hypothetical protein
MAGGPNASAIMCRICYGEAGRTYEGMENDHYRCSQCGNEFVVDWRHGQPEKPCWPASPEEVEVGKRIAEVISGRPNPVSGLCQTDDSERNAKSPRGVGGKAVLAAKLAFLMSVFLVPMGALMRALREGPTALVYVPVGMVISFGFWFVVLVGALHLGLRLDNSPPKPASWPGYIGRLALLLIWVLLAIAGLLVLTALFAGFRLW